MGTEVFGLCSRSVQYSRRELTTTHVTMKVAIALLLLVAVCTVSANIEQEKRQLKRQIKMLAGQIKELKCDLNECRREIARLLGGSEATTMAYEETTEDDDDKRDGGSLTLRELLQLRNALAQELVEVQGDVNDCEANLETLEDALDDDDDDDDDDDKRK